MQNPQPSSNAAPASALARTNEGTEQLAADNSAEFHKQQKEVALWFSKNDGDNVISNRIRAAKTCGVNSLFSKDYQRAVLEFVNQSADSKNIDIAAFWIVLMKHSTTQKTATMTK